MSLKGVTCIKEGLICEYITLQEWDHHRRQAMSEPFPPMMSQHQAGTVRHLLSAKVTGALGPSEVQVLPKVAGAGLFQGLHQATGNHAVAERELHTWMSASQYSHAVSGSCQAVLSLQRQLQHVLHGH